MNEISAEFQAAIGCWGSSPVENCECCGRVNFAADSDGFDEGELADLLAKQKKEPDKFISHDCSGIAHCVILGDEYVWDCPCQAFVKLEARIWDHRDLLVKYIKLRAQAIKEKNDETLSAIDAIN